MSSCFVMRAAASTTTTTASRSRGRKMMSWRWWRKCAARLAAAARSKLLRRSVGWPPTSSSASAGGRRRRRRREAAPPRHHARSLAPVYVDELYGGQHHASLSVAHEEDPATGKLARAAVNAMSVVLSPMGGGGGGAVAMGEVDLRAELFIRKFWEEMRLQSQRSVEAHLS